MRNNECAIYISTRRGWTHTYVKDEIGWTQTGPNGVVRRLTAEQLLSHLLPPLVTGGPGNAAVRVERREGSRPGRTTA